MLQAGRVASAVKLTENDFTGVIYFSIGHEWYHARLNP